jgi:hypothetical protein
MTAILSYFLPNIYGKNPNNFTSFVDTIQSKTDVYHKYCLLNVLDQKYNFIQNNEIYLLFEFELFRKLITNLPKHNVSDYEYYRYIDEFNNIPEETKSDARYLLTINFICDIFKGYCTGTKIYSNYYVDNCLSLCVAFGKKNLNKRIRRDIYSNLNHEAIINSKLNGGPLQAAMLKVYCRFMTLTGVSPSPELVEKLKALTFTEKKNTDKENNTKYNKAVRLFNSVIMDRTTDFRDCNTILKEDVDDSSSIPIKNYNYYILFKEHLAKSKNGKISYIINLGGFDEEYQVNIVDKLNKNMDTLVVKTMYVNNDPKFEMVMFDIKGQNYIKRWWDSKTNTYQVEVVEIVE